MVACNERFADQCEFVRGTESIDHVSETRGAVDNERHVGFCDCLIQRHALPGQRSPKTTGAHEQQQTHCQRDCDPTVHRSYEWDGQSKGQNWNSRGGFFLPRSSSSTIPALSKMTNTSSLLIFVLEKNKM